VRRAAALRELHPKLDQELLGHAAISIILDTYSHVLPTLRDGTARAMGNVLSGLTCK